MTFGRIRRAAAVLGCTGVAALVAAGPASAANSVDIDGIGPTNVVVGYTCEAPAAVVGIKAMVGAPDGDRPAATGVQRGVTCDGGRHSATVALVAAPGGQVPLPAGRKVQIRVALVDRADTVVSGQAKVATLG